MFQKAVKHESKLRLAIAGPSGSGKEIKMNPTVKIATNKEYWGEAPDSDDIERLSDLVLEIEPNAEIELVDETFSWNNRNDEESARILERAWIRFCGQ